MIIIPNNKKDTSLWIPICKPNPKYGYGPRAFLPIEGLSKKYTWGYKAKPSEDYYIDALIGIQEAFVNKEDDVFQVSDGKGGLKPETQKKYKWRHGRKKSSPLLSPTLGWVNVPTSELTSVSAEELEACLIESGTDTAKFETSVICTSSEQLKEKAREIILKGKMIKPKGQKHPRSRKSSTTYTERDAKVVAWVKLNSKGYCECCLAPAPFLDNDKQPFLEVHHVKWLTHGGTDTITNTVAVCPNCHRELHYGESKSTLVSRLYSKVGRLIPE